jgi:formiminoglutamase
MLPIDMSAWTGRVDDAEGPRALRWHQRVAAWSPDAPPGLAIIGFACDEGVRRNGGRVGAAAGPQALRWALANLAWHQNDAVYDVGDVACPDGDLEGAHERLAGAVSAVLGAGHRPLVLGGGHESAFGTFMGLVRARPDASIGIVNIDAHFDLRAAPIAHSGTPFAQIAELCSANGLPFRYLCLGIAEPANTVALFDRAATFGAKWRLDTEIGKTAESIAELNAFINGIDLLYLSLDLDVLPAATMPAVSAPAIRGVPLETVELLLNVATSSGKLAVAEVVEFNPNFDADGRAARVAAGLVWKLARDWGAAR